MNVANHFYNKSKLFLKMNNKSLSYHFIRISIYSIMHLFNFHIHFFLYFLLFHFYNKKAVKKRIKKTFQKNIHVFTFETWHN